MISFRVILLVLVCPQASLLKAWVPTRQIPTLAYYLSGPLLDTFKAKYKLSD